MPPGSLAHSAPQRRTALLLVDVMAFFGITLDTLLTSLGPRVVILNGSRRAAALRLMSKVVKADITPSHRARSRQPPVIHAGAIAIERI